MNSLLWKMEKREGRAATEDGGFYKIKMRKDGSFETFLYEASDWDLSNVAAGQR